MAQVHTARETGRLSQRSPEFRNKNGERLVKASLGPSILYIHVRSKAAATRVPQNNTTNGIK